jgi:hypothetical protein
MALMVLSVSFYSCGAAARGKLEGARQAADNDAPQSKAGQVATAEPQQIAPTDPKKFALVVAGVGGEDAYKKRFGAEALSLYDSLTRKLGFEEKHVWLLTEDGGEGPENGPRINYGRSTADEVRSAFSAIKSKVGADSLVLIVLVGHGSFDGRQAKFNLVGPDLTAEDYAALIGSMNGARVVFVNCASSSGEFIKPLSAENRIVITATRSGNEQNATVFADKLVAGLGDFAADTDKNGRLSVAEVFSYASKLTADWYKDQDRLATEHALLDDNGDGTGHEQPTAGDGVLAKTTFLDSRQIEEAAGDPETARLLAERQRLEEAIEKLKARKAEMKPEEYESELERLLLELAKTNQTIKARQK